MRFNKQLTLLEDTTLQKSRGSSLLSEELLQPTIVWLLEYEGLFLSSEALTVGVTLVIVTAVKVKVWLLEYEGLFLSSEALTVGLIVMAVKVKVKKFYYTT
jgi:hypothetical protein